MQFKKFCLKSKLFFTDFSLISLEYDNNPKPVLNY